MPPDCLSQDLVSFFSCAPMPFVLNPPSQYGKDALPWMVSHWDYREETVEQAGACPEVVGYAQEYPWEQHVFEPWLGAEYYPKVQ